MRRRSRWNRRKKTHGRTWNEPEHWHDQPWLRKNQVNAEQMLFLLRVAGYEILPDPDGADLVIINTCGFIEDAKAEAIDNILAMGEMKKRAESARFS